MVELYDTIETDENAPARDILQNVTVLFADDSQDTLDMLKFMADGVGWHGIYVRSASQMIEVVNHIDMLDAIVADINYFNNEEPGPRITGITAAREIRKILPSIPIVFISAYVTSIIREEIRRVSAEVVEKPFDLKQLFTRLTQLIYWHRLAMRQSYRGPERRQNSVNQTNFRRRASDRPISVPDRIMDTIRDLRNKILKENE